MSDIEAEFVTKESRTSHLMYYIYSPASYTKDQSLWTQSNNRILSENRTGKGGKRANQLNGDQLLD